MQNFRIKKIAVFITPVILLSGLNFCFVNIQIALGEALDSPEVVFDRQPAIESCADNHSPAGTADSPTIKEKNDPSADNTKNPLPSCCLNHDNAAKIEAARNQENNPEAQQLTTGNDCLNYYLALNETFSACSLGLSPPQEDFLSSIVKKE